MTEQLHLSPKHRAVIGALLREHLPGVEVWAYGSRVNGRSHGGSDLDLVLRGPGLEEIPLGELGDFEEAVRDSSIPFLVEARDWAWLPERFHREIGRGYVVLVEGEQKSSGGRMEWRYLPFSDAVAVNPSVRLERGKSYPFVDMGAINIGCRSIYASQDREFRGGGTRFQTGDTLMARITPCLENGKIARYCASDATEAAHGSTEFIVIRGRPGTTDTEYAYYLAQWEEVRNYAVGQMTGTSGRQRVPVDSFDHLMVPIPPFPEQRAIAHVLGTLDDKIELNRRMNTTLEAMARALFKDWFVDFGPTRAKAEGRRPYLAPELWDLFPDAIDDEDKPEGWNLSEIGKEVEAVGGATPSTKVPSYWEGGEHHWATPKDLSKLTSLVLLDTDRKITGAGVEKISSGLLPVGTVLLSSRAPIGYLAVAEVPTAVNQGFIAMVCKKRLPNIFVLFWCYENLDYIKGISGGSTFAEISKKVFRPVPVVVPPEPVIAAYEGLVRPLYDHIITNTKESASLVQTRDLLLPKLMSGDIRLAEAEKAVEAAT